MSAEGYSTSVSLPTPICPARAPPSAGLSKGVFRISLFIHVQRVGGEERPRGGKIPHCQSNAKLPLSGMRRADAAMRCQSGSPSSAPWVPINCSGARLSASSSPGRWYTQAEFCVQSLSRSAPGGEALAAARQPLRSSPEPPRAAGAQRRRSAPPGGAWPELARPARGLGDAHLLEFWWLPRRRRRKQKQ